MPSWRLMIMTITHAMRHDSGACTALPGLGGPGAPRLANLPIRHHSLHIGGVDFSWRRGCEGDRAAMGGYVRIRLAACVPTVVRDVR